MVREATRKMAQARFGDPTIGTLAPTRMTGFAGRKQRTARIELPRSPIGNKGRATKSIVCRDLRNEWEDEKDEREVEMERYYEDSDEAPETREEFERDTAMTIAELQTEIRKLDDEFSKLFDFLTHKPDSYERYVETELAPVVEFMLKYYTREVLPQVHRLDEQICRYEDMLQAIYD